jgi:DNA-binding phage protein
MAAMKTTARPRRLAELRGHESDEERLARQLKVQALSATGDLLGLFNEHREQKAVSKAELARHIEAERTSVSRLLGDDGDANPTLHTIVRLLWGLGLRAEINIFDREPAQKRLMQVNDERASATQT